MRSSSRKLGSQDLNSVAGSSPSESNSVHGRPVPVWVTHTPTPASVTDNGDNHSAGRTSPSGKDDEHAQQKGNVGRRFKFLLPQSLGGVLHKWTRQSDNTNKPEAKTIQILPNGTRVSPPVSPLMGRSGWDWSQSSSHNSQKPLLMDRHDDEVFHQLPPPDDSMLSSIHPAEYYAEKLEVYNLKYSYLKSWPGLLRLLAGLQLVFGGMVVACVIAYIQKDSEWSNSYGMYNGVFNNGQGLSGYSYSGPMTHLVLVVAGLCWILTLILLVMGMSMYYRTILLDSKWWPLTEAFINLAMFLLYMAAGIVYINDLNRGGLCFMSVGINPLVASLCRVEGGQMAGTTFMFINMVMYLGSFPVCLKMWRHEAARRERKYFEDQPIPLNPPKRKIISFRDETDAPLSKDGQFAGRPEVHGNVVGLNRASEYTPKVHIIADYVIKYPEISCMEEREKYRAVFNDQYQEYRDLHRDVSNTLSKFTELDAAMARLLSEGKSQQDRRRIQSILRTYEEKKRDPAFLEKRERCEYLKGKLGHIKNRIRTFDQETTPSST